MLWTWLLRFWSIHFLLVCNPVPNPGTPQCCDIEPMIHAMQQPTLHDYFQTTWHGSQGEGCQGTTALMRAADWTHEFLQSSAKSGEPLPMGSGPQQRSYGISKVQKRSYRRACRRAIQHGTAWYKGKVVAENDFPFDLRSRISTQLAQRPPGERRPQFLQGPTKAGRVRMLTWNPGGLAQGALIELRLWLRQHPYDIVVIPETRWGFTRCWQDETWSYIHSSTSVHRTGGVLVMISKRLISNVNIGYEEVIPGRLLHVRLHFALYSFDLLAVYQHVDDHSVAQMQLRSQFWSKMDDYMYTLPARNQLVCCGDFNCAMSQAPPWVGTSSFRWQGRMQQGHQHRDMHRLHMLLQRHELTATNTWSSAIGPSYFHGMYAARIDFFLVRLHSCDGIAKQSHYLNTASFLPVNQTHHFPLECTIPKNHMAYHKNNYVPACTYQQRAHCREDSLQESTAWLHLSHHVANLCTTSQLQASRPIECIQDLHQAVIPKFHSLFPGKRKRSQITDDEVDHQVIQSKWHHRRCIRRIVQQPGPIILKHILQAWFHWGRFCRQQRIHQRQTRHARRHRFDQLCADATHAANANDAHGLFTIINRYTPKRPLLRARLKTLDGKIADQHTAHAMTVEHIRNTWQGNVEMRPYSNQAPGVPISCSDIERAIMQLHPNRSVACPFLPAIVWKSAPRELANLVHSLLESWWNTPEPLIPQEWRDAWMFFLPKPGKPSTHPSHLRPIALMEPIGKLVLGLLTEQLKSFHLQRLCCQPHFGFLPLRGALDAVTRVVAHCRGIRTLIAMQKRTVARQMATRPLYTFCGGLQMFLDLKHAFDSVNRPLLFDHLKDLHTPHPLLHLISSWHVGTRYNLVHNGRTTSVNVDTGLRQGCKAAPLLWVLFMNRFLQILMDKVGQQWIVENVTLYADDIHVGASFFSNTDFRHCFGCVLDAIETLKLQLSYAKTYILSATTGSGQKKNLKGVVERTSKGATILLPRADQTKSAIPLRSKGKYLGTELSYGPFEQLTWNLRLKAARSAFARLQCWFKSRQFPVQHRIYLWKVCILSIMHYGICATNVTVKILHEYQQTIYTMMRTVLHNYSYRTRETHQQVFQSVGLEQPLQLLARHVTTFWSRLQRRALTVQSTDFVHNVNWTHLPEMLKLIQCVAATVVEVTIASDPSDQVQTQAQHQCPSCDFRTTSIPNLRRHMTHVHNCSQFRTSSISPLDMSLGGKPQCKGCYSVFTTWRRFFIHVERNCCQVLEARHIRPMHSNAGRDQLVTTPQHPDAPDLTGPAPPMSSTSHDSFAASVETFWPLLTQIVQTGQFERLREDPAIGESLAHNCLICGLWCNRCQELNAQYRLHHSDHLRGALACGAQITHQLAPQSPCTLCAKPFRRGHCCSVTTQVAVLQLHGMRPAERERAIQTCTLCDYHLTDMCQLHQHLSQTHGIQIHDWCPSRDALTNSTACAHCGASFVDALRIAKTHIGRKMQFFQSGCLSTTVGCCGQVAWGAHPRHSDERDLDPCPETRAHLSLSAMRHTVWSTERFGSTFTTMSWIALDSITGNIAFFASGCHGKRWLPMQSLQSRARQDTHLCAAASICHDVHDQCHWSLGPHTIHCGPADTATATDWAPAHVSSCAWCIAEPTIWPAVAHARHNRTPETMVYQMWHQSPSCGTGGSSLATTWWPQSVGIPDQVSTCSQFAETPRIGREMHVLWTDH